MDLRDEDETCPDEPAFDTNASSEHFLKAQAEKNRKGRSDNNLLSPNGGKDEDSDSASSNNSRYRTCIRTSDGGIKDDYVYKRKLNPRYETFLSNDETLPGYMGKAKFLSKNYFERVVIACYQRSGSTLLRKYIENITHIITGSDGDVHSELDRQLKDAGLVGECILGSKIWIAQTNFPEEIGFVRTEVEKGILLIRNPCDAIFSHFNMCMTNSIDDKLSDEEFESYAALWDDFVAQEIKIWKEFIDYWMVEPPIPTYVVRYEDLVNNPQGTLKGLFKFLLNTKNISGTLIDTLIDNETSEENKEFYIQNEPGYSFEKFTEDQLNLIKTEAGCTLLRCGYVKHPQTKFFELDSAIEDSKSNEADTIVRNQDVT